MSSTKELIARLKALDLDLTDLKGDEWADAAENRAAAIRASKEKADD